MVTPRAKASTAVVQEDLFAIPAAAKAEPAEKPKPKVPEGPRVYSVTEITQNLRDSLRERFPETLVQGEICDYKGAHRSGHLYFGLKDEKAQLRAVMWKPDASRIPFEVKNGQEVILTGRLDFYPAGGSLQLVATRMEPVGIGALQLKFEQLKEKLKAEGLFDPARKRRVAPLNWRIGVVTGRSTAALQDMLKIFTMRFPLAEIFFFHAAVQGEKAAGEIVAAIQRANRYSAGAAKPLDVLIVGRGGGSYEDLFVFNDESVARALAASKIPTVSAVGHEIDFTIADMVADRRSATPSHAAQETVPELALWLVRLEEIETMFQRRAGDAIQDLRQRVDLLHARILGAAPQKRLELQKQTLKERRVRLERLMSLALERRQQTVGRYAGLLDALSPLRVIERGYSLTEGPRGLVRSSRDAAPGDTLKLRFSDGFLKAQVLERTELG